VENRKNVWLPFVCDSFMTLLSGRKNSIDRVQGELRDNLYENKLDPVSFVIMYYLLAIRGINSK
jgi:hypothetical protein